MASKPENTAFNFATMDWDAYEAYRPHYPREVYDWIYDHHRAHGGSFNSALDVGGGIGIITKELLQRFDHVTLSDAAPLYISQARSAFASFDQAKLSFLQTRAEDLEPDRLEHGPVDLITAGECLHWADLPTSARQLHKALKPGGTLAVLMYGIHAVYPTSDPEGKIAFDRAQDKLIELYDTTIEKQTTSSPTAVMNARLNGLPLDPERWEDVRRIHVREDDVMCSSLLATGESCVRTDVEAYEVVDKHDLLSKDADIDWAEGYIVNVISALRLRETAAQELKKLRDAMGDRRVKLEWPFVLILATKR